MALCIQLKAFGDQGRRRCERLAWYNFKHRPFSSRLLKLCSREREDMRGLQTESLDMVILTCEDHLSMEQPP